MRRLAIYLCIGGVVAAAFFAGDLLGRQSANAEMQSIYEVQQALGLVRTVQVAAMVRLGDTAQALKWSENSIDQDLIGLDAFAEPNQPPLDSTVLSALKLAALYRAKYTAEYENTVPTDSCCVQKISHALSLGSGAKSFSYAPFAAKYLDGAGLSH